MREALFRGKRVDNGEWVEGATLTVLYQENTALIFMPQAGESVKADVMDSNDRILTSIYGNFYQVIPATVEQYTGLKDKKRKKIFSGDICEFDNGEPDENERYTNYVVQWDCINCQYVVVDGHNREDCLDIFFAKNAKVIGNIHDNPELLGGVD
ncbi:MAG TPA: hypothetical protein DCG28_01355 [Lachnospiraceae bacterium]|nr:hypothetical protein [Lachnospiraceae bacterium]